MPAGARTGVLAAVDDGLAVHQHVLDAARVDGASEFRIYRSVVLPVITPILATMAIWTFLTTWNDFMWPLIVLSDDSKYTLPVALANLVGEHMPDTELMMAGSVLTVLPVLLAVMTFAFPPERDFAEEELAFIDAVVHLCAQALARVRLFEAEQRARSRTLTGLALTQSDRALVLGEEARGLARVIGTRDYQAALAGSLAALPTPLPRPGSGPEVQSSESIPYRLPVEGRLRTGVGEISDGGVHARGHRGHRADAEDQPAGPPLLRPDGRPGRDHVGVVGGVAPDADDLPAPAQAAELLARPPAVGAVLGAQRVEDLDREQLLEPRHLDPARGTPRGPEVHQHHLATVPLERDGLALERE